MARLKIYSIISFLGMLIASAGIVIVGLSCVSSHSSSSPPAAPTGLAATAGDAAVTLSWNKESNAVAYNIYWSTTSGVTPANGTKIPNVTTPYTQAKLTNGTTYYYVVTAINNSGESGPSVQVSATPSGSGNSGTPPAAPTGVVATAGNGGAVINWNTVSGATSYDIYWSITSGVTSANGTKIANVTSPYSQTGLTNGTTYYYVVTAVNSYGESAASTQVSATPFAPVAPAAPTGVKIQSWGSGTIYVNWNTVTGASTYTIYFSTTSGTEKTSGTAITGITGTFYIGSPALTPGLTYYFVVTAVNSYGESTLSSEVSYIAGSATPPNFVTATSDCNGNVAISWSDGDSSVTSYTIYYSTTSGTERTSGLEITGLTNTSTTINGLTQGTTYYFEVTAVNSYGESAASNEVSVIPGTPPPPTGVTATGGDGQVTISWSSVSCATSYNIYWSTNFNVTPQNGIEITGAKSPYIQTGLTNGQTYYYVVTAVNSYGESAASQEVSAIVGVYTYTVGASPFAMAIDAVGNVWVTNSLGTTVSEITYGGGTISSYTVGSNPIGIAIDASGNVWVADRGSNTVTKLNSSGSIVNTYPVGSNPWGIAIDKAGNVWVTNIGGTTVSEITYGGGAISSYTVGSGPAGIAIDASGNVWVANEGSNTVTELNSHGSTVMTYSVAGSPSPIAIDSSGNAWVGSVVSETVSKINPGSGTISTYGVPAKPSGIAIDASGNIGITGWNLGTIVELDSSGNIVNEYSVNGTPCGIAVDTSGDVWITDYFNDTATEFIGSYATGPQYWPYTGPQWP